MEALLCLLYSILFIYIILKWNFFSAEGLSKSFFTLVFLLKAAAGLALWWVFTYYYSDRSTADIYKYFDDSKVVHSALKNSFADYLGLLLGTGNEEQLRPYVLQMDHWYREFEGNLINEDRTMIRVNALLRLFSFGYFNVHTVFFCFLSLTGLAAIYKTFSKALKEKQKVFALLAFLFPSLLFWGSGVLKESLVLFAAGMLVYHFGKLMRERLSVLSVLSVLMFGFLLLLVKSYMLALLAPGFLLWIIFRITGDRFSVLKLFIVAAACTVVFFLPALNLPDKIITKQRMFINVANGGTHLMNQNKFVYISPEVQNPITLTEEKRYCKINDGVHHQYWFRENNKDTFTAVSQSDTATYWIFYSQPPSGSRIAIGKLENNFFSFVKNIPFAFLNVLSRPYMWEAKAPLLVPPAIENVLILLLVALSIFFSSFRNTDKALFWLCIWVVICLFLLVGFTTPVIGAIVRYKIPALPFLFAACLLVLDAGKLTGKFRFLKPLFS